MYYAALNLLPVTFCVYRKLEKEYTALLKKVIGNHTQGCLYKNVSFGHLPFSFSASSSEALASSDGEFISTNLKSACVTMILIHRFTARGESKVAFIVYGVG